MTNSAQAEPTEDMVPASAYPEPRPATLADDYRTAIVSKMLDTFAETNGDLPLKTVRETAGRSVLLEFGDDSRLLIQTAAIPSDVELDFGNPNHVGASE